MPSPVTNLLQIPPVAGTGPLSAAQRRFNELTGLAARLQEELRQWETAVEEFRPAFRARIEPLQEELRAGLRQWLFAMDAADAGGKWSKSDHALFDELIREVAGPLQERFPGDDELRALFLRHGGDEPGAHFFAPGAVFGTEELADRLDRALDDASTERDRAKARRQADRRRQREQAEVRSLQSVREVYRKVASALHPDREPDAEQRAAKTRMMQAANRANEEGDLLTLLQLQLQLAQIDPARARGARDEARLAQFNKALARQVADMEAALAQAAGEFLGEFGIEFQARPAPTEAQLERAMRAMAEGFQAELADLRRRIRDLGDPAATRRMLKAERALRP